MRIAYQHISRAVTGFELPLAFFRLLGCSTVSCFFRLLPRLVELLVLRHELVVLRLFEELEIYSGYDCRELSIFRHGTRREIRSCGVLGLPHGSITLARMNC
jgi:hypothetical protein